MVDLTQPLEPKTPVLALPPQFAQSPPFEIEVLSEYDERGPAWYWNKIKCGEHTGTHFDAPIHWISGKDLPNNATDTIPVDQFIGPACVIDAVAEAEADPDFLVTPEFIQAWEARHGRIPAHAWVLFRTGWSRRLGGDGFLNVQRGRRAHAGLAQGRAGVPGRRARHPRRRAWRRSAPTPARPSPSTRPSPATPPCTAPTASAWPA